MSSALRAPETADAAAVAGLVNEHWPEPFTVDHVLRDWTSPNVDPQRDARVEPGGYALVEAVGGGRAWIDLQGRPSRELVDWAEARAKEQGARFISGAWSSNEAVLAELDRRGYRRARFSDRMRIELDDALPDPVWRAGLTVRALRSGDERTFYEVHQETFADMWERVEETPGEWTHRYVDAPSFDPGLWFLAAEGADAAGVAMCKVRDAEAGLGWVDVLGVRSRWRRRGIGRALLLHAFAAMRKVGLVQAGLGVDGEPTGAALRLYESVGMRRVARFVLYEKDLS